MFAFFSRSAGGVDTSAPARVDGISGAQFVKPAMTSGGNLSLTTNADGVSFVAYAAQALTQLTIVNDTGTDIEFRQDGSGATLTIFDGTVFTIFGINFASQISIRRKDTSTSTVAVKARWEV